MIAVGDSVCLKVARNRCNHLPGHVGYVTASRRYDIDVAVELIDPVWQEWAIGAVV